MTYVHLHLHDTYSLLDGYGSPEQFVKRAKTLDMKALAQTNHGTISGHIAHSKACKEAGILPVFGCEFYVVEDMHRRGLTTEEEKDIKLKSSSKAEAEKMKKEVLRGATNRSHLLVIALNMTGYQNLRTLISLSFLEGFYRKPRIDYRTLLKHKEGLFVSTACMQGDIPQRLLAGDYKGAKGFAIALNDRLKGNFALEIMPLDTDEQRVINKGIQTIQAETGIKVIATNDTHYVEMDDSWTQDVLIAIGTGRAYDDKNRLRFGDGNLYLKSEKEMADAFMNSHPDLLPEFVAQALKTTWEVIADCDVNPLETVTALPAFEIPENSNHDEFLRNLCIEGWKDRGIAGWSKEIQAVYGERVKRELGLLREKGFANYFLIVWDMVMWAKNNGIAVGPARGSSAGSLVAYLLRITDIDPIRFGLSFERFIAPHRMDYPDIDIDFEDIRRGEVKQYLIDKYGKDHVANVATFNTLGFRSAFRDSARAFKVPLQEVDKAIGYLDTSQEDIEDSAINEETIKKFEAKFPNVLKATNALVGQLRAGGTHAAGVVLADRPLKDVTAMELRNKIPVVALTKDEAEALGLVKIDILGLRTMTIISHSLRLINKRRKKEGHSQITVESLTTSLNDPKVFAEFAAGNTEAVFQFNKPGGKRICEDLRVRDFEDLAAVNALDRPGPLQSGGTETYIKRSKGGSSGYYRSIHPIFEEITSQTKGVILYQEQVMRLCREFAGLDWPDVHAIRKAIAKSQGAEALEVFWQKFKDGVVLKQTGSVQTARNIWDQIVRYGGYAFNKSHAVAYAAIGYATMWLKLYYPAEYLCSAMLYGANPKEAVLEARRRTVRVKEPDINKSEDGYTLIDNEVYAGFTSIKGIGDASAKAIIEARGLLNFFDFEDFMSRVPKRTVNKKVIRLLIESGAFDSVHPNTDALYKHFLRVTNPKKRLSEVERRTLPNNLDEQTRLSDELLMKRVALVPFLPEEHPALRYGALLKKLDKLYPKRSTVVELKEAGRAYARNEIRTITGMLRKFETKIGDFGTKRKIGLAWIEDETGEMVVRLDPERFETEVDTYSDRIDTPIIAVVSPISEYRADVREAAILSDFHESLSKGPQHLNPSMDRMMVAPGRVVTSLRTKVHKPLKRAIKLKKPMVLGLAMRVWSGPTRIGEMGFVDLADESGMQLVLIWPASWENIKGTIQEGKIYEAKLGTTKDQTLCYDSNRGHYFKELSA